MKNEKCEKKPNYQQEWYELYKSITKTITWSRNDKNLT